MISQVVENPTTIRARPRRPGLDSEVLQLTSACAIHLYLLSQKIVISILDSYE
jgi:hypothetical protein